jgi:hypothetical protein
VYFMFCDESNLEETKEKKFFVYGGLICNSDNAVSLHQGIENIRMRFNYLPGQELKFTPANRPTGMSIQDFSTMKGEILDLCFQNQCVFVSYVIHHQIAKGAGNRDKTILFAADHVISRFNDFLDEVAGWGFCLVDKLPVKDEAKYLQRKFTIGLENSKMNSNSRLDKTLFFGSSSMNTSHFSSLTDIVLGSFRYCVNAPADNRVATNLFKKVIQLMWHRKTGATRDIKERGLILRPVNIKIESIKKDYDDLLGRFRLFLK